jgi:hypothetical protein
MSYPNYDVVVVDNGSTDGTADAVKERFPGVKLIRSDRNLGGAGGRNLGFKHTTGDYILFVDDDVVVDKTVLDEFISFTQKVRYPCILSPKILDYTERSRLLGIGHDIDLLTGKAEGIGYGEWDRGQFDRTMEVPMVGATCLLVKRKILEDVGSFDETLNIPYEDSDFCLRARKLGVKVIYVHRAKVWHKARKHNIDQRLQWLGMTTPERAYFLVRNKILFMRKHARPHNLIVFVWLFLPVYLSYYLLTALWLGRLDIFLRILSGSISGLLTTFERPVISPEYLVK